MVFILCALRRKGPTIISETALGNRLGRGHRLNQRYFNSTIAITAVLGIFESPEINSASFVDLPQKREHAMPTATTSFTRSILYQDQQKTIGLLEKAAKKWTDLLENGGLGDDATSRLSQMIRICLRSPGMMRDLWEWAKTEAAAGRLRKPPAVVEDLRGQLGNWLHVLSLIQNAARVTVAAGHPVGRTDELGGAQMELNAILNEVNEGWPAHNPSTSLSPSYEDLRALAERLPPPAEWYLEKDDLF
jgi:hypothetical protein